MLGITSFVHWLIFPNLHADLEICRFGSQANVTKYPFWAHSMLFLTINAKIKSFLNFSGWFGCDVIYYGPLFTREKSEFLQVQLRLTHLIKTLDFICSMRFLKSTQLTISCLFHTRFAVFGCGFQLLLLLKCSKRCFGMWCTVFGPTEAWNCCILPLGRFSDFGQFVCSFQFLAI